MDRRDVEPMTAETIYQARMAQRKERVRAIADLLAGFDGVIFTQATSFDRAIYLNAAEAAMDAAQKERLAL